MRKGPLVVYAEDNGIVRAMANIPGVKTADVTKLNLLDLAPGGQFGRFVIWTESAFNKIAAIYGKRRGKKCPEKSNYWLPRAIMENADVTRIINSDEVQSVLRPKLEPPKKTTQKKNPLKNKSLMSKLDPAYKMTVDLRKKAMTPGTPEHEILQAKKKARIEEKKKYQKEHKRGPDTFYKKMMRAFAAKKEEKKEEAAEAEED